MVAKPQAIFETVLLIGWATLLGSLFAFVDTVGSQVLHFRLPSIQIVHLPSEDAASSLKDQLKSLGIGTTQQPHQNHVDIELHTTDWRMAEFDTRLRLENWKRWLESTGFETKSCRWK